MPSRSVLPLLLLACAATIVVCDDPASRARVMLQKMTLEEKIAMCHGTVSKCANVLLQRPTVTQCSGTLAKSLATPALASPPCA